MKMHFCRKKTKKELTLRCLKFMEIEVTIQIFDTFLELLNSMYGIIIGNTKQ